MGLHSLVVCSQSKSHYNQKAISKDLCLTVLQRGMDQILIFFLASSGTLTNPEMPVKGFQTTVLSRHIEDLVFKIA